MGPVLVAAWRADAARGRPKRVESAPLLRERRTRRRCVLVWQQAAQPLWVGWALAAGDAARARTGPGSAWAPHSTQPADSSGSRFAPLASFRSEFYAAACARASVSQTVAEAARAAEGARGVAWSTWTRARRCARLTPRNPSWVYVSGRGMRRFSATPLFCALMSVDACESGLGEHITERARRRERQSQPDKCSIQRNVNSSKPATSRLRTTTCRGALSSRTGAALSNRTPLSGSEPTKTLSNKRPRGTSASGEGPPASGMRSMTARPDV